MKKQKAAPAKCDARFRVLALPGLDSEAKIVKKKCQNIAEWRLCIGHSKTKHSCTYHLTKMLEDTPWVHTIFKIIHPE